MESGQNVSLLIPLVCVSAVMHMLEKHETLKKGKREPILWCQLVTAAEAD